MPRARKQPLEKTEINRMLIALRKRLLRQKEIPSIGQNEQDQEAPATAQGLPERERGPDNLTADGTDVADM